MKNYYKITCGFDWCIVLANNRFDAKLWGIGIYDSKYVEAEYALPGEIAEYTKKERIVEI